MSLAEWTDEALMEHFQGSLDEDTFRELASRHYENALRLAQWHCGDVNQAEDAVQETLIRIVRNRHRYQPSKPFAPWLHTILRNVCHDMHRSRLRQKSVIDSCEIALPLQAPDHATISLAQAIVNDLPPEEAKLLELRYLHGFTFHELAARMGCSLDAAKKRVQRILQSARDRYVPFQAP